MRIFRLQARTKNNRIVNQCVYHGIDKLRMYARPVWERYNRYAAAELSELNQNTGKWVLQPDPEQVRRLINPYARDND